jgi:hypothetical protein
MWFVIDPNDQAPNFSMNYRVKTIVDLKDISFQYGQQLALVFLAVCLVGICLNATCIFFRTSEDGVIIEKTEEKVAKFNSHVSAYVKVGNLWDPH